MPYSGTPFIFPTVIRSDVYILQRLDTYGDFNGVSFANFGNPVENQRGLIVYTRDNMGDSTFFSLRPSDVPGAFFATSDWVFNPNDEKFNVAIDNFKDSLTDNVIIDFDTSSASTTPVVNVVRGLEDDRYGELDEVHEFIFTGAYVEIENPTDSFDVEVFGGDCFISKMTAKINDSNLGMIFGATGCDLGNEDNAQVRGYRDFIELISLYIESTVNADLQSDPYIYPVLNQNAIGEYQAQFRYDYNFGYSATNEAKVFLSRNDSDLNRLLFPSRLVNSDTKVFQGDIEGFDRYRATAFYDLPEDYRSITKLLRLNNDNLYSVQEEGVAVIPINKRIIEDANGGQLSVLTDTLINNPQYILNKNGSQHIRTVQVADTHFIFADARQREVLKIGGTKDGKISAQGMYSYFLENLKSQTLIPEKDFFAGYDFNNEEYVLIVNPYTETIYIDGEEDQEVQRAGFGAIWSDKMQAWNTEFLINNESTAKYLVHSDKNFYIIGSDPSARLIIEEMYNGDVVGQILGTVNSSYIDFVFNPEVEQGKIIDVLRIDANNRLTSGTLTVFKEDGTATVVSDTIDLNIKPRHDAYEVPVLRDQNGSRIRGKYAVIRLYMDNGVDFPEVAISSVLTKYREDGRQFR